MDTNTKKAVGIITVLSLLLGLSIGQLHRQHNRIKKLEETMFTKGFVITGNAVQCFRHHQPAHDFRREMKEMRTRLDLERSRLERERARLHRELERFHEMENNHIHRDKTRRKQIIRQEEL